MALKSVGVIVPDDALYHARGILGVAGISANRLIEAAIRAFRGESIEEIRAHVSPTNGNELKGSGRKDARLDETLIDGIGNKSRAARVGLGMIAYGFDRESSEKWADTVVKWGKQSKPASKA